MKPSSRKAQPTPPKGDFQRKDTLAETTDLLTMLETSFVWDMRYWRRYKDMSEIMAYIQDPDSEPKMKWLDNTVKRLKELGCKPEKIALAMDRNPKLMFAYRLAPCGIEDTCPILKDTGDLAACNCKERCHAGAGILDGY